MEVKSYDLSYKNIIIWSLFLLFFTAAIIKTTESFLDTIKIQQDIISDWTGFPLLFMYILFVGAILTLAFYIILASYFFLSRVVKPLITHSLLVIEKDKVSVRTNIFKSYDIQIKDITEIKYIKRHEQNYMIILLAESSNITGVRWIVKRFLKIKEKGNVLIVNLSMIKCNQAEIEKVLTEIMNR